jgi:hypothetical protein
MGNLSLAIICPISSSENLNFVIKKEKTRKHRSKRNTFSNFKGRIILKILKRKVNKQKSYSKAEKKVNEMALAGFFLGIAGLFLPGIGILGLIFSLIGLKQIELEPNKKRGKRLAKIGKTLSIIGIFILLIVIAVLFKY